MAGKYPNKVRRIPLTKGLFALVDEADYEWLSRHRWRATRGGGGKVKKYYAVTGSYHTERFLMHRLIMGLPRTAQDGLVVDHINRDSLDNRRANLRVVTISENNRNRAQKGYRGVYYDSSKGVWNVRMYLGSFPTEDDAAKEYDRCSKLIYGDLVPSNLPD